MPHCKGFRTRAGAVSRLQNQSSLLERGATSGVAESGMRPVTSPIEWDGSADGAQPGRPARGRGVSGAGRPSREWAGRFGPNRDRDWTAGRTFKGTKHGSAESAAGQAHLEGWDVLYNILYTTLVI